MYQLNLITIWVEELTKEAGVKSGAFYGYLKFKTSVFAESISAGLTEVRLAVKELQEQHGEKWWYYFAEFYMMQRRTCDLSESCALQSLTPEIIRANDEIKKIYEQELLAIVLVASKKNKLSRDKVWSNLALLTGGVNLSRAVQSKKISDEIAQAILSNFS